MRASNSNAGVAWLMVACVSITSVLPPPVVAGDELEVYGRVNVTVQYSDEAGEEQAEVKSNASRIGVKGEGALSAALKAIYQLEWAVNVDSDEDDDTLTPRNQFVGLEGGFGTFKVGRHDTALKEAQGDFDLFDDLEGDIFRVFNGENRLKDYIGYTTPTLAKALHVTANYFPGEDDPDGDEPADDAISVSLVYETDLLYAALAHDSDVDAENVETTRVIGGYTFGAARLMLLYQLTDAAGLEEDGHGASLAWTLGKNVAKLQYLAGDIWLTRPQTDTVDNLDTLVTVGLDHEFSEDTVVFGFYSTGDIGGTSDSVSYVAIGIQHKF